MTATTPTPPPARPKPRLTDADTGPFWQAAHDHRLMYQSCGRCGETVFFRRQHCPHCGSEELVDKESAGEGVVYSYTVVRQHGHPFFKSIVPYVVGAIDLDEGFRMLAPILAPDPEAVAVGQRVALEWEDHEHWSLPVFQAR